MSKQKIKKYFFGIALIVVLIIIGVSSFLAGGVISFFVFGKIVGD
jgi:hypothetical protein